MKSGNVGKLFPTFICNSICLFSIVWKKFSLSLLFSTLLIILLQSCLFCKSFFLLCDLKYAQAICQVYTFTPLFPHCCSLHLLSSVFQQIIVQFEANNKFIYIFVCALWCLCEAVMVRACRAEARDIVKTFTKYNKSWTCYNYS